MGVLDVVNGMLSRGGRGGGYRYEAVPEDLELSQGAARGRRTAQPHERRDGGSSSIWSTQNRRLLKLSALGMLLLVLAYMVIAFRRVSGLSAHPQVVSQLWGQYSPFYPVPSEIDPSIPPGCRITFVQVLSRHGARDPTANKTARYNATIARLQAETTHFPPNYDFIRTYVYRLGADSLTSYGEREMLASGAAFYHRYSTLARQEVDGHRLPPFIRASGQDRVIISALNWTQGFYGAQLAESSGSTSQTASGGGNMGEHYSGNIVVLPEKDGANNTLNHGLCTAFETGPYAEVGDEAQAEWLPAFIAPITARLNAKLPGANVSDAETIQLMDLCPFDTVAHPKGKQSPFCSLFTLDEWLSYDYYQSLGKFYGFAQGNRLGPTQGVGFANELVARLTRTPVVDRTTTNVTLDSSPKTFPLDRTVYADFSHDNDMTSAFAALGLYNATKMLNKNEREGPTEAKGYSASWTVPFAGRMYVEKMQCGSSAAGKEEEELVRILVNDRVVPLQGCEADALGRCRLGRFVDSLAFARGGGLWDECFA